MKKKWGGEIRGIVERGNLKKIKKGGNQKKRKEKWEGRKKKSRKGKDGRGGNCQKT